MMLWVSAAGSLRADWPQYLQNAARTGETSEDIDPGALRLVAQVALDDAILSSPIVVDGRCFAVDQMGTAYAVDAASGTILWRAAPEEEARGGNTSGPCYADGHLVYGTTAGKLHWLRASDGRVVRSVDLGWPIVSPVATEHGHFYVATVDSSVHSFDRDGNLRWKWDHHQLAQRWQDSRLHRESDAAHFGGAALAVVGDRVLAPLGYDLVCLRDLGDRVERLWQVNQPVSRFDVPVGVSADGQYAYVAWPKSDGQGAIVRHRMSDGQWDRNRDLITGQWAVYSPPAFSGSSIFFSRHAFGVSRFDFSADRPPTEVWTAFENTAVGVQPTIAAVALTPRLVLMTTLYGDLRIVPRDSGSARGDESVRDVYRFSTRSRAMITSEPVVAAGRIVFGSDDGCLYLLGTHDVSRGGIPSSEFDRQGQRDAAATEAVKQAAGSAAADQWPSAFGSGTNTSHVANPAVKPPFRLRWAARSYGDFKHPLIAADQRVISVSLAGLVVCRDQATGRIHWRVKLPGQAWSRASALAAEGKIFVPRVSSPRYAFVTDQPDALYCLDAASGKILWSHAIGRSDWLRASPVLADGVVAYGSKYETPRGAVPIIGPADRWRANGEPEKLGWVEAAFDDASWPERLFGSGARRSDPALQAGQLQYLRRSFPLPQATIDQISSGARQLGLVVGPHDQTTAFLNGVQVYRSPTQNGTDSTPSRYDGRAADFVPLDIAHGVLEPSNNVLAIAVRRAQVESNVSSSTSLFPPRLVLVSPEALTGPVIDAWDADTGQPRWQIALQATGRYIEGPAGATRDGIMYFTGGGSDPGGRGETVAIRAASGQRLWSTPVAYASRTGTPSLAGDLLILPGSHRLPLAAISIQDGRLVWQQKRWTGLEFVHAASVCADGFTVNTKYQGGAMLHDTATGERRLHGGSEIDLAGQGHTCGTIVLLGSGYAVAATNRGIFFTDLQTGQIVYQTPGFASQTCPNPAFAEGRMFYAPLNNGMIYCFEPVLPSLGRAEQ